MLEVKLFSHLSTSTNVTVTSSVTTRIYPDHLPQGSNPQAAAFPALVYERLGTDRVYSLSGYANLERADVAISCWAETVNGARTLANNVHTAMQGATAFNAILLSDNNEAEILPDENIIYRTVLNFSIWNRE